MDQFDQAQALELAERNGLLQGMRRATEENDKPSLSHCEDCGDEIPHGRRALRGVTRCVICQTDFEKKQKKGLR